MSEKTNVTSVQEKVIALVMGLLLLVCSFVLARETAKCVNTCRIEEKEMCVVIDAGHGGVDPGKIGVNGELEKEINLEIAFMLKQFLEAADIKVVMTRETDCGLYEESSDHKKAEDMKNRVALIEKTAPTLTVSIHQNSYEEEFVHGAQVFYYTASAQGEKLADLIQKQMVKTLEPENNRQIKENNNYYMLKKTKVPIVIVECGFLSNYEEASKLTDKLYQQKIAWAIHLGILQYLNQNNG